MSATQLYAQAIGIELNPGEHCCFYCGGSCDEQFPAKPHIKATFTALADVGCIDSDFVCSGCIAAANEKLDMPGKDKPQKTRNYSWVVAGKATPYTKADRAELLRACTDPPEPPFAIALAVSGQKNMLYATPVNHASDAVSVRLEEETVTYRPARLIAACGLLAPLLAYVGRTALESPNVSMAIAIRKAGGNVDLLTQWHAVLPTPLGRLALFLTPAPEKHDARNDRCESVPPAVGGARHAQQQSLFG